MKRNIGLVFLALLIQGLVYAQKGRNQVNIAMDAAFSVIQQASGFAGFIKGLYGVGNSAQLSLMFGVGKFEEKNIADYDVVYTRVIPVLVGYKQNIKKIYIEPQVGYGELGGKVATTGDYARPSIGAFYWAIGAGYDHKRICAGIRFQQANGSESPSAGIWQGKHFKYTGIHLGFKLF